MKVNIIKFFRNNKPEPIPQPIITKSGTGRKFIKQGKKLDKFM